MSGGSIVAKAGQQDVVPNPDEMVVTEEGKANQPSFAISVDWTLLNTDFTAIMERKETANGKVRTALLVMPTDDPKGGMTLMELVQEVNKIIASFTKSTNVVSEEDVKKSLEGFKLVNLDDIMVELRQVFIYYNRLASKTDSKDAVSELEYAVNFVIHNKVDPVEDLKIFKFKSLSAAIWNTTRTKILSRMSIGSVDDLLK